MIEDFNSLRLTGSRVALRSIGLEDVNTLFAIIQNSRAHLAEWLPWIDFVHSADDERHIVEQWVYDMQIKGAIHLCIIDGSQVVGIVGTHQIDWMNQRTSVGYWVSHGSTGNNFATEATAVLLQYLFESLRLHRVSIQAATGNGASNRVIEKLGFKLEGVLRGNERIRDTYLDHNIYGMTQADFAIQKNRLSVYFKKESTGGGSGSAAGR